MLAVVLLVNFLLWQSAQAQTTCYNSKGKAWNFVAEEPTDGWFPCNKTASVTNCCGRSDYCLSNGLCLDAVQDNMISQQGCSKSNWDTAPCFNYCAGEKSSPAGFHFLWRCQGPLLHCCGNNRTTTCCDDPGVKLVEVDTGRNIHPPNQILVPDDYLSSTASTVKPTGSVTGTSPTAAASTPSSTEAATPKSDSQALTIGVAVGVSIGVLLIAAIIFLAIQVRKRNKRADQHQAATTQNAPTPATQASLPHYFGYNQYNGQHAYPQQAYEPSNHPASSVYSPGNESKAVSPPAVEIGGPMTVGELDGTRYERHRR